MKKIITLISCLVIMLTVAGASADEKISVYVNNEEVIFDVAPELKNDRTFVPIRKVAEMLSLDVGYEEQTREVLLSSSNISIKLKIDSNDARVNNEKKHSMLLRMKQAEEHLFL